MDQRLWRLGGANTSESGNNYLINTNTGVSHGLHRAQTNADVEAWLSYKQVLSGGLAINLRFTDFDNRIRIDLGGSSAAIVQRDAAVQTTLDSNASASTTTGQWYDVYMRAEGAHVEVWRGKQGEGLEKILETDAATELTTTQFNITLSAGPQHRKKSHCLDNTQAVTHSWLSTSACSSTSNVAFSALSGG